MYGKIEKKDIFIKKIIMQKDCKTKELCQIWSNVMAISIAKKVIIKKYFIFVQQFECFLSIYFIFSVPNYSYYVLIIHFTGHINADFEFTFS